MPDKAIKIDKNGCVAITPEELTDLWSAAADLMDYFDGIYDMDDERADECRAIIYPAKVSYEEDSDD